MSITATFWDHEGRELTVTGEPGSNFGLRIEPGEVVRLFKVSGATNLPFHIMAEGYGDDEDWVGLQTDDIFDGEKWDTPDELGASGWGPFEVSLEVPLLDGRAMYFGTDLDRLALEARSPIKQQPFEDVLDALGVEREDILSALWRNGWAITAQDENGAERRHPLKLYLDVKDAEWHPRYEPGTRMARVTGMADDLGWSCVSCKEDVGWVKHERVEESASGSLSFDFECGHCGFQQVVDMYGDEVKE